MHLFCKAVLTTRYKGILKVCIDRKIVLYLWFFSRVYNDNAINISRFERFFNNILNDGLIKNGEKFFRH